MKSTAVARYDRERRNLEVTIQETQETPRTLRHNTFIRAQSPLFRATHPKTHLRLDLQDLPYALNEVNKNINHRSYQELLFLKDVCVKLNVLNKEDDSGFYALIRRSTNQTDPELAALDNHINFLDFCLIAAVSEAMSEISAIIGKRYGISGPVVENDYRYGTSAMLMKLEKMRDHYNQMYLANPSDALSTELVSCGMRLPESAIVYQKVCRETGRMRFYDFVLYSPLFNVLHDHAIANPLDNALPVLPKITISS